MTELPDHLDEGINFGGIAVIGRGEVPHWWLESGINTFGSGRVRGLTIFAMTPVYRKSAIGSRSKSAPPGRDTQPVDARRPTVAKIPLRYHAEGEAAPYLPDEPNPPAPRWESARPPSTHSTGSVRARVICRKPASSWVRG